MGKIGRKRKEGEVEGEGEEKMAARRKGREEGDK
jgi:hypothetical protein